MTAGATLILSGLFENCGLWHIRQTGVKLLVMQKGQHFTGIYATIGIWRML
jgi:hypothetical protein